MNLKSVLFISLVILTAYSCIQKENVDLVNPSFSTPLTFSAQTDSSMTLSWGATDAITKPIDLSYKVVYSTNNDISTVADAEANGTVLQDWTINVSTANMTGLSAVTTYYAAVMVRDVDGNTAISSGSSKTICGGKIMFMANVPNGNLGGVAGADAICNSQKPTGSGTFKAVLTDGVNRRACFSVGNDNCNLIGVTGRFDWPLSGAQTYCTSDYSARVGTTNANGLLVVPAAGVLTSTSTPVYTGLNISWGSSGVNCGAFADPLSTSSLGSANGVENGTTQHSFISNGAGACSTVGAIYCAEQ